MEKQREWGYIEGIFTALAIGTLILMIIGIIKKGSVGTTDLLFTIAFGILALIFRKK